MNGLYMDPENGEVLDLVGGIQDIRNHIIRCIGDPLSRFKEDHLRLLRAVRFCASLRSREFFIEERTWEALCSQAEHIDLISPERIREELNRMLCGPDPVHAMELLAKSGLLRRILPEVTALKGVPQPPEFHPEGDVWTHTMLALGTLQKPSLELAWATLLHDIGKPDTMTVEDRIRFNGHCQVGAEMAEKILNRLKFSNKQIERITAIIRHHMEFVNVPNMRLSTLKKFIARESFEEEMAMHRADCLSSHGDLSTYDFLLQKKEAISKEELKPKPFLLGRDLIAMGYEPGNHFREILDSLYDLQLEGVLTNKEQAESCLNANYPREKYERDKTT